MTGSALSSGHTRLTHDIPNSEHNIEQGKALQALPHLRIVGEISDRLDWISKRIDSPKGKGSAYFVTSLLCPTQ